MAKPNKYLVNDLWVMFTRDRKKARGLYKKHYKRDVDSPAIDAELEALMVDQSAQGLTKVNVPAKLLLALVMRPRAGKGRKTKPPKEVRAARAQSLAIAMASRRWKERVDDEGQSSKAAKEDAAKEAYERYKNSFNRTSLAVILRDMRRD